MNEVLATGIWIALGFLATAVAQTRLSGPDRRVLWWCFWAHVVSVFVLIWLTFQFFGRGDLEVYYYYGEGLADYIRQDPGRWAPEVLGLILQQDVDLPMDVFGTEGSSTTSLIGMTAFALILTGSSQYASGLLFSLLALSGQFALYLGVRDHFGEAYRRRVLIAVFLVPSAVFWTSGVVKEAVTLAGMGWMIFGLNAWITTGTHRVRGLFWILAGGVLVAISKAYVLFPMTVAALTWWFWERSLRIHGRVVIASRPFYLIGAAGLSVVAMVGLGELFPRYSLDSLAQEAAQLQETGERITGGSSYAMGDAGATSLSQQLTFAPVALTAALFRPFLFEAHNPVALINALETTAVLLMWWWILKTRGLRGAWRALTSSPILVFSAVFVLLFALGVGLATTNLGTLSRYRVPMMPLYALVLLSLLPSTGAPQR